MFKLLDWIPKEMLTNHLSLNTRAIRYLEQNPDKIAWHLLSQNPQALHLLQENPEKIDWYGLSLNPKAMHLLKQHPERINWYNLSKNPGIFEYDYKNMSQPFTEELMTCRFHPKYIEKFVDWGFE